LIPPQDGLSGKALPASPSLIPRQVQLIGISMLAGFLLLGCVSLPAQTAPAPQTPPPKNSPPPSGQSQEQKIDPTKEADIRMLLQLIWLAILGLGYRRPLATV
jgi:hypothetical protein